MIDVEIFDGIRYSQHVLGKHHNAIVIQNQCLQFHKSHKQFRAERADLVVAEIDGVQLCDVFECKLHDRNDLIIPKVHRLQILEIFALFFSQLVIESFQACSPYYQRDEIRKNFCETKK